MLSPVFHEKFNSFVRKLDVIVNWVVASKIELEDSFERRRMMLALHRGFLTQNRDGGIVQDSAIPHVNDLQGTRKFSSVRVKNVCNGCIYSSIIMVHPTGFFSYLEQRRM